MATAMDMPTDMVTGMDMDIRRRVDGKIQDTRYK